MWPASVSHRLAAMERATTFLATGTTDAAHGIQATLAIGLLGAEMMVDSLIITNV